jgi:truncated hemoglobin YjbI
VPKGPKLLATLGGEAGCKRLSAQFYARVREDPVLRPLFPGKSVKCAIEEFGAFLIQFLGGDEEQIQRRWWLSLRESHARFSIGAAERRAWLKHMTATLEATPLDEATRRALTGFFEHSSAYVIGEDAAWSEQEELAERWVAQRNLDTAVGAIADGRDQEAISLAPGFAHRPSVFVGLLARMLQSGRLQLLEFVENAVRRDASLATRCFGGRTLLHYASGSGCLEIVTSLLRMGTPPDIQDTVGHTPLYRVANECSSPNGPDVVRALVLAGADVNAPTGVTRATPLHMAARRGHLDIARTLLEHGAAIDVHDSKGCTPLQRAVNCRRQSVAQLLLEYRVS